MPPTFKMLALGDSVMWGQGLAEPHKFVRLVRAEVERLYARWAELEAKRA